MFGTDTRGNGRSNEYFLSLRIFPRLKLFVAKVKIFQEFKGGEDHEKVLPISRNE